MRNLDFNSWQGLLSTVLGLMLITLIGVGVRLLVMQMIQQRQQRENRQINERLRVLMAAYKTLGGSFTGNLVINPTHRKDMLLAATEEPAEGSHTPPPSAIERAHRMRDAVEAALSDIILLGTEDQVLLAVKAANDMVAGTPIQTDELVVSLRNFIREALGLEAIPAGVSVPKQGPTRVQAAGRSNRAGGGSAGGGTGGSGRGGGGGAGGMGAGVGMMGVAGGAHLLGDQDDTHHD
jgi:uncharacterized membrane protein YgcG